jgi:hypothetical protein
MIEEKILLQTSPFVRIGEIAKFRDRDTLAGTGMPSFVVGVAFKKGSNMFMETWPGHSLHCFVCFGGNTIQAWALSIEEWKEQEDVTFFSYLEPRPRPPLITDNLLPPN